MFCTCIIIFIQKYATTFIDEKVNNRMWSTYFSKTSFPLNSDIIESLVTVGEEFVVLNNRKKRGSRWSQVTKSTTFRLSTLDKSKFVAILISFDIVGNSCSIRCSSCSNSSAVNTLRKAISFLYRNWSWLSW